MVGVTLIIFYFYSYGTQELRNLSQVMGLEPGCDPRKSGFLLPALKHYLILRFSNQAWSWGSDSEKSLDLLE